MAGLQRWRRGGLVAAAVLLPVTSLACAGSTTPPPSRASFSVEYAPGLTEDVYLPDTRGRVPLVVLVPGGSWTSADPGGLAGLASGLAADGVAAAPTHIRAAQDGVRYPTPVEDVLCAVAAAVATVREKGFTPAPVAVLGHSSGAHLAALAVLAVGDLEPACSSPTVAPDALVGLSGPYDISRLPELATALLGSDPQDDPAGWASANPVLRAGLRPDVPVLLLHGEADTTVPVDFTSQFARALEDAGHPTTVQLVPGADHQSIYTAEVSADAVATWLLDLPTP
jgi:acetyl esterase/lipase